MIRVEFINPFISAANDVFQRMLGCSLARGPLSLKDEHTPIHEVSGLIGLSGKCRGMVVLSIGRATALGATEVMLGSRPLDLNSDVIDAVGELTNMIAGTAKTRLEEYQLTISLPTVICGRGQVISFPSQCTPMVIPFDSDLGPVCVQVGLVEASTP